MCYILDTPEIPFLHLPPPSLFGFFLEYPNMILTWTADLKGTLKAYS